MAEPHVFLPGIERSSWAFADPSTLTEEFHLPGKHDQRSHGRRRGASSVGGVPIVGYPTGDLPQVENALKTAMGPLKKVDVKGVRRVSQKELNMMGRKGTTVLGSYDTTTQKIELSSRLNAESARLDYMISNSMAATHGPNFHVPVGNHDPLTATLTHEVGHAGFESMDMDQQDRLLNRLSSALGTERVPFPSDSMYGYLLVNQKAFQKKISMYAGNSTHDAVAEGWCEYRLAPKPRLPARVIGQTFEEFLS